MDFIKIVIWAIFTLLICIIRYLKTKGSDEIDFLELTEFILLALAVASIVSSCHLLYLAFTSSELMELLGIDIIILILGSISVIWVSFQYIESILNPEKKK